MGEQFPRTAGLPTQSPLFWVDQKDRYLRQLLIRDIEATTTRRLLVYFANRVERAQIEQRDVSFIHELWGDVGAAPVDLLLETIGGATDATEALVSLIRSMSTDFRVIVPSAAKSNGTLLCLAAKSIVMGAASELGPIDPAISGIPCTILAKPEAEQKDFVLHHAAKDAIKQTQSLAEKLLSSGMLSEHSSERVSEVVEYLSTRNRYFSHGSVIDHQEARQLGLAVEYLPPDDQLWQRVWLLYCMYDFDCRRNRYLKVFEGNARSSAIVTPPGSPAPTS